ncbi:hypothetical protein FQA39_LY04480 [Lamprigera yunnana]|nr:hypothetical protein FQA39_LY04480 [Lamprigera yunnana]
MEKETVFSGPLTLEEIKTSLSIKKPVHLIKKRSTICVSEPYRTIYNENPQIDLLLRMQMTDDEDDSHSYIASECSETCSSNDKNMAPDTIKFIHKLEDILHVNGTRECDHDKFQNNSVILVSDDDKSCDYIYCDLETDTKTYEEVEFKDDVKIEKTEEELQMSINSLRFTSFEEYSVDSINEKSNEVSNHINADVEAKCSLVKQDVSFNKQDIDKEQFNKSIDITKAEFVENLSDQSSCSEEKYTDNDALHFNDTLEEMEIALKYGLDDSVTDEKDNKSEESIIINELITDTINKENITSNANTAVAVKVNKDFKFKQPINIPPSPSFHKIPNFQNIVSPVAVYIKNTPRHPLKQNVACTKTLPKKMVFQDQEILKPKVIQPNVLPEVIYNRPRKVLVTKEACLKLPANIQKLLPNTPTVIKHCGRLAKKNDQDLADRLLSEDLSSTNLTFNSTTPLEEISVYNIKDVYIS